MPERKHDYPTFAKVTRNMTHKPALAWRINIDKPGGVEHQAWPHQSLLELHKMMERAVFQAHRLRREGRGKLSDDDAVKWHSHLDLIGQELANGEGSYNIRSVAARYQYVADGIGTSLGIMLVTVEALGDY